MGINTGLIDKSGKPIHTGDILQIRLGKFAKSGGPIQVRVIQFGKNFNAVGIDDNNPNNGGFKLTAKVTSYFSVIIEKGH